jgi:hypothetical protein
MNVLEPAGCRQERPAGSFVCRRLETALERSESQAAFVCAAAGPVGPNLLQGLRPNDRLRQPDGSWYRIASSPWDDGYYSPANTFMNGDPYTQHRLCGAELLKQQRKWVRDVRSHGPL